MSIVAELLAKPGVIAAGQYAYRGDRFSYKGKLSEEDARRASIMCRATTMGGIMEGEMLKSLNPDNGLHPMRGWMLRGSERTVCVVANTFCFISNKEGKAGAILDLMRRQLSHEKMDLV